MAILLFTGIGSTPKLKINGGRDAGETLQDPYHDLNASVNLSRVFAKVTVDKMQDPAVQEALPDLNPSYHGHFQ